jgi:hypothetical protein
MDEMKLLLALLFFLLLGVEQASAVVYCRAGVHVRGCVARPGVVTPRVRPVARGVVVRRPVYRR